MLQMFKKEVTAYCDFVQNEKTVKALLKILTIANKKPDKSGTYSAKVKRRLVKISNVPHFFVDPLCYENGKVKC